MCCKGNNTPKANPRMNGQPPQTSCTGQPPHADTQCRNVHSLTPRTGQSPHRGKDNFLSVPHTHTHTLRTAQSSLTCDENKTTPLPHKDWITRPSAHTLLSCASHLLGHEMHITFWDQTPWSNEQRHLSATLQPFCSWKRLTVYLLLAPMEELITIYSRLAFTGSQWVFTAPTA